MQQPLEMPFPLGGLRRRQGYQSGDIASTPHAVNVVPDDSEEGRTRGGCRPGLTRRFTATVGNTAWFTIPVTVLGDDGAGSYQRVVAGTDSAVYASSATTTSSPGEHPTTFSEAISLVANVAMPSHRPQVASYKSQVVIPSDGTVVVEGDAGDIASGVLTETGTDFSSVDTATHVVELHVEGEDGRTYAISSATTSSVTIENPPGDMTGVTYRIVSASFLVDVLGGEVNAMTSTKGFVPTGASSVAVYRDRLVWVVGRVWYMSRQGVITDYDYGADASDGGRAVAGTLSDAGQPGEPIVAMAVGSYEYLVMFAEDTTWVLRGDPAYGGTLTNISRIVGCVSGNAFCHGPDGIIFFLSKIGLYTISGDMTAAPQPVSDAPLPQELKQVSSLDTVVSMAFDSEDNAIAVYLTPKAGDAGKHWWIDLQTGSFWPIEFPSDIMQPLAACSFGGPKGRQQRLVLTGRDGYLREFNGETDDGTVITSEIVLGPYRLGGEQGMQSIVTELDVLLDSDTIDSGTFDVSFYIGDASDDVARRAIAGVDPDGEHTIESVPASKIRDRLRGGFLCVRIEAGSVWAFEGILAQVAPAGRRRVW